MLLEARPIRIQFAKNYECRFKFLQVTEEQATISYASAPCKLTSDLLTLKVVSESRVTWPTTVPILFLFGLSVLDLGPKYATDRQTDVRRASSLNASALWGLDITAKCGNSV